MFINFLSEGIMKRHLMENNDRGTISFYLDGQNLKLILISRDVRTSCICIQKTMSDYSVVTLS